MALRSYNKPIVWMAYPGEHPTIDLSAGYIVAYSGGDNFYIDGFEITNISNPASQGFRIDSTASNVTFRRNDCHNLVDNSRTNQACVFIANSASGQYWSFTENEFHNVRNGMGIEAYKAEKVLVENNSFYDFYAGSSSSHALGPKMSYRYWFIRDNEFRNCGQWSIWADGYTSSGPTEHIDISFNVVKTAGLYAFQANYDDGEMGTTYVYRNTFVGPVDVRFGSSNRGPFNFYNNVIVNSASGVTCSRCLNDSVVVETDNLTGTPSDNIVDSNGDLTSSYSQYLGRYGHQIYSTRMARPNSPQLL
jgi:hypothetical protein